MAALMDFWCAFTDEPLSSNGCCRRPPLTPVYLRSILGAHINPRCGENKMGKPLLARLRPVGQGNHPLSALATIHLGFEKDPESTGTTEHRLRQQMTLKRLVPSRWPPWTIAS